MAHILSNPAFQETLKELSKAATPQNYADVAALGVIVLGSAGYLLRKYTWDKPDPYDYIWYERPQLKSGRVLNPNKETRNIAQKLDETNRDLVIFWGSQSGTAEGFANRLARECHHRFGLEAMAADLSDFDADTISLIPESKLAIFICSTFGEGDPSDNTAGLWDYLLRSNHVSLKNLRYFAFGLGNSNYKYYNRVIDVVVEQLDKFGARPMLPVGRADDAEGGTEEDFMAWKDQLFAVFKTELKLEEREISYEPTLVAVEDESLDSIDLHLREPIHPRDNPKAAAACSPIKPLTIRNPRELFHTKDRNCVHMELDLSNHVEVRYKTGDHLAVWPTNPDAEVDSLLAALGRASRAEIPISIKSLDPTLKVKVPTPTTTLALFRYYLEICAPVSRDTVLSLSPFAPTPEAKCFLWSLGRDKTTYAQYLSHTHLTLGRLLTLACPGQTWTSLPLSYVIETLPRLQPRYYSISSSSVISPRHPSITALVSTTPLTAPAVDNNNNTTAAPPPVIPGLTSTYLLAHAHHHPTNPSKASPHPNLPGLTYPLSLSSSSSSSSDSTTTATATPPTLYAHIRKSKFKLPASASTPLIMVAAGTGLAPFRGFVAERARLHSLSLSLSIASKGKGKSVGRMLLFFGCRRADEDYIYREEIEGWVRELNGGGGGEGDLLQVVTAFSREGGGGGGEPGRYVQDRVEERMEEVLGLLGEGGGASFHVCGRAGMAREVGRRVGEGMGRREGWGEGRVREWCEGLRRRGKWLEDVWG
ncbi:nadph-ferrihemoprotein reductase [Diplodia corticola]|uniref:NADPH--hemoprotein reductase n=1 Tax=Diplodia corticola TaxID=236234 RepID=A0A1J9QU36_9PEZI|nr:nadph-ferrihemoprotein reductase [Diplodia corticola]OJD31960.1 nadph-ferrihemoprotein reductase [Diplodia corticola]